MPFALSRRPPAHALFRCALCLAAALLLPAAATAQSNTDGTTPAAVTPGAPAGSYPLSGFDTVNLFNGNLNFRLLLLTVGGRGEAQHTLTLPIEQRWRVEYSPDGSTNSGYYYPSYNNWYDVRPGYGPGVLLARQSEEGDQECWNNYVHVPQYELTRLTFVAPDGTEYELTDKKTGGKPLPITNPCTVAVEGRGQVWTTADGQSLTFIFDDENGPVTGYLLFRDGRRYRVVNEVVTQIRDRNGNLINFAYDQFRRVTAVTDSLGRTATVEYDVADVAPYGKCDRIKFKGFGAQERIIRVSKGALSNRLRPGSGYAIKTFAELFDDQFAADPYTSVPADLPVTSAVWLPDGRSYQLYYNPYGELARVVLPTGGALEYDWAAGVSDGAAGGVWWPDIYRRVVERRVYAGGGTGTAFDYKMTYSRPETQAGTQGFVTVEHQAAGGAVLSKDKHYFYGSAAFAVFPPAMNGPPVIPFTPWDVGKEYKTEALSAAGTVLRRVEQTWQQRAPVSWWSGWNTTASSGPANPTAEPANDPRRVTTVTRVEPYTGGANLASKQTAVDPDTGAVGFDQYNNPTDSWEYDYGTAGAVGAFLRRTHADYVTAAAYVGADANPALGAHLRSLPSQTWVSPDADGTTKASLTVYEYDNYATDARHAPLVARAGITGHEATYSASFTKRGNLTGVTSYASASDATLPSTTSTQYDVAGNLVKSVDPNGKASTVGYADSFSNPATGAGAFTPNTYAFASSAASPPVPSPTGAAGTTITLTTSTVYDFWTGSPTSSTDANAQTTTYSYRDAANNLDPLDRLRKVVRPGGTAAGGGGQTTYDYGDTVGNLHLRTRTWLDAARSTDSYQYFDRLGRPYRVIRYENHVTTEPWITADTEYDALGRVKRSSMPYRAAGGAALFSTDKWTEIAYDALGRVTTVTTKPDNAVVTTAYAGDRTTVTDQAGKVRRSVTDALGRLVRVDEPNATGALDVSNAPAQPTHYTYDVMGNLRKVTQGAQLRFFMYDSLGRLTRAKNPEQAANTSITGTDPVTNNAQWSLSYAYDAAGNLTSRTDPRGVTTTYAYDALGRATTVNYSDTTPDVKRTYDGATLGKGQPWHSYSGGDETTGATVHDTVVDAYNSSGAPLTQRQRFKTASAWAAAYQTQRTYDLAGNVLTQTYPSGRVATYTYDAAGRPASFTGDLGDGVQRSYATAAVYDELGGMSQERFGTQTPLYHKRAYNSRGQLSHVRLSTYSAADPDVAKRTDYNRGMLLNYFGGAGTADGADNNGNLRRQTVQVPHDDAVTASTRFVQNYTYDTLNRLKSVEEKLNDATVSFRQTYNYDRWGNRTVDAANTSDLLGDEAQFDAGDLAATNRLYAPGDVALAAASRKMQYDAAGNLTRDIHTGAGTRSYDAEGRMTAAQFLSGQLQTAAYAYDADGRRVRRDAGAAAEVWQVYGAGGELLAEYAAGGAPSAPQKEYGYRGGELLVTAEPAAQVRWLVADQLGTPRMVVDQTGSLAGVSRHDYLPFGKEIAPGAGGRAGVPGYGQPDTVRQKFTGYERDGETALDFAQARYYSSQMGRFSSPDEPFADQYEANPQSWNLYSYVRNNPLKYTDPTGRGHYKDCGEERCWVGDEDGEYDESLRAHWRADDSHPQGGHWDFGGDQTPVNVTATATENPLALLRGPMPVLTPVLVRTAVAPAGLVGLAIYSAYELYQNGGRPPILPIYGYGFEIMKQRLRERSQAPTEPTPTTHPGDFEPVRGTPAKRNKRTGEIWHPDRLHGDHWEVYRNKKDYDNGRRDRAVWNDGRFKEKFR